ncbi:M23 family metallopeptidase [Brevibacillus ruminantium]|uniref:M23 family metallopeptidase n=1 Tax=Brevibacillus ruminantium TaxID=2950604 RepID=A0ABY4WMD1_9BACL|nr:M23 family metallopeptidase [Brevibacillus ruminantium]USG65771.1 M23 family metallopeptidase [Brevibacillus ruminantium]
MQSAEWMAKLQNQTKRFVEASSTATKRAVERAITFVRTYKKQTLTIAAGLLLTTAIGASANYYYKSNIISIYHVAVNGQEIGIVNDPQVVHTWTKAKLEEEKAKHGLNLTMSDYITFSEEQLYKGQYDNEAAIKALSDIADIKVEAVKLVVDGNVIGYAESKEAAEKALTVVKEKFSGIPLEHVKKQTVAAASIGQPKAPLGVEVSIKEDVKMEGDSVTAAQVLPVDKLEELLSKGTFKQVTHTVVEGDCVGCIAKKYGITSKDIYANNPGITENTLLQLGQQINVTALRPLVTVQVKEEVTEKEAIPFATQIQNNEKLPKGESKVVQEGKEGSKSVRYQVVKENGQVVEKKILEQEVISQPVVKIVERGTKVIPSRGTGRLAWPARGTISSGFGMRWGRLHKGIDIAGSGAVRAADNGRVVSAGWDGDYGKAILIDHGNGMQTRYGHLNSINVKVGDVVSQGKQIGVMGSTGQSTGVHLHFEVIQNGRVQNPVRFLK